MTCTRPNCTNALVARGLCEKHYRRIPKGWVDATPVIAHYQALRAAGMSVYRIAEVSGVHRDTLYRMGRRGPTVQIETASKVLAIAVPSRVVAEGAKYVDATGTRRRLQALMAAGWPIRSLEDQAGRHSSALWKAMHTETVFASTAAVVADLFDRLQLIPGPSEQSRRLAQGKGWALPLAWNEEDIDDPDGRPYGKRKRGRRASTGNGDAGSFVDRYLDAAAIDSDVEAVAARLGVTVESVKRQRARYRDQLGQVS